jgi:hypothetical protein
VKVILSRKGFDSGKGSGESPSPILPCNTLVSLPIPDAKETHLKYENVFYDPQQKKSIKELMDRLKITTDTDKCHLDPDINYYAKKGRHKDWIGAFGQAGAAAGHLRNKEIKRGDLFLFFGWFKRTIANNGVLKFDDALDMHVIFGYLQIQDVVRQINSQTLGQYPFLDGHPHLSDDRTNNTIFIGRKTLSFNNQLPGYGVFKYSDHLRLTKAGETRSKWDLDKIPQNIFKGMSYHHPETSWKDLFFQSRKLHSQEFVVPESIELEKWVKELFDKTKIQ